MQGQIEKDASKRINFEIFGANSGLLVEIVPILETSFGFKVIYTLDGFDLFCIDLAKEDLRISACWDVWNGVYIVAVTENSSEIVIEIGQYLNELWGSKKDVGRRSFGAIGNPEIGAA